MSNSAIDRYLRDLNTALAGVPDTAKRTILDDVRAHAEDALDAGRDPETVIAALGAPDAVARNARDELGVPAVTVGVDPAERAGHVLHWAALALGVVTAMFVTFLLPLYSTAQTSSRPGGTEETIYSTATLFEEMGIGIGLLPLAPAALVLLPLVLPAELRRITGWAVAALVTAASVIAGFTIGGFYFPLALLLWGAMLVPAWIRGGRRPIPGRIGRGLGALGLALPAFIALGGLFTGTLQDPSAPLWVTLFVVILLAVLFAVRSPYIDAIVAVLGTGLMLLGIFDGGMLLLAIWWAGGLWFVTGLCGTAARGGVR